MRVLPRVRVWVRGCACECAPSGGPAGRTRSGRREGGNFTLVRALSSHDLHLDGKDDRGEEKMGCLTISFGLRESGIVSDQCSPRTPGRARGDPTAAELGDGSSLKRVFVSLRG